MGGPWQRPVGAAGAASRLRAPDRAAYIRDVRAAAEQAGFAWSFWNLFDGLGLMDDAHVVDPALVAALGLGVRP